MEMCLLLKMLVSYVAFTVEVTLFTLPLLCRNNSHRENSEKHARSREASVV